MWPHEIHRFNRRLMDFVKKRRYELENPTVSQPEAEPDFLLGDGF